MQSREFPFYIFCVRFEYLGIWTCIRSLGISSTLTPWTGLLICLRNIFFTSEAQWLLKNGRYVAWLAVVVWMITKPSLQKSSFSITAPPHCCDAVCLLRPSCTRLVATTLIRLVRTHTPLNQNTTIVLLKFPHPSLSSSSSNSSSNNKNPQRKKGPTLECKINVFDVRSYLLLTDERCILGRCWHSTGELCGQTFWIKLHQVRKYSGCDSFTSLGQ